MRDRLEALKTAVSINCCAKRTDDCVFLQFVPYFLPAKLPPHAFIHQWSSGDRSDQNNTIKTL